MEDKDIKNQENVAKEETPQPSLQTKRTKWLYIGGAVVAVLLLAGALFMLYQPRNTTVSEKPQNSTGSESAKKEEAESPSLTKVTEVTIPGSDLWLFAVNDGTSTVLSSEADGKIMVAKFNPDAPSAPVNWQTVASSADTGGLQIADHWHVYAHGAHWISFSTIQAKTSYLLKLNNDLATLKLVKIADNERASHGGEIPTNDMFAVPSATGVDIGHFYPGHGHRVFRFDAEAKLLGKVDIGGQDYEHANGASAEKTQAGFVLFAPDSLAPGTFSGIKMITFDENWKAQSVKTLVEGPDAKVNAAMPTSALLQSGYRILHARVKQVDGTPAQITPGGPLPDDSGPIVRYIVSPDGKVASQEQIVSSGANRPHTLLLGSKLITTWDQDRSIRLRIDELK